MTNKGTLFIKKEINTIMHTVNDITIYNIDIY